LLQEIEKFPVYIEVTNSKTNADGNYAGLVGLFRDKYGFEVMEYHEGVQTIAYHVRLPSARRARTSQGNSAITQRSSCICVMAWNAQLLSVQRSDRRPLRAAVAPRPRRQSWAAPCGHTESN
jgi:hypothetical protein